MAMMIPIGSYWMLLKATGLLSQISGDQARKDIFPYVCQIIDQAGNSYYHLSYYYLVEDNGFSEYIPT